KIYLPVILALSLVNYFLRFLKWNHMLSAAGVSVERNLNIKVWLSGLAFSVSPGKIGEIIKSALLHQIAGIPASRTVPVVVADRFSDVLALVFLMVSGVFAYSYGLDVLAAGLVLTLIVFLLIRNRRILSFLAGKMLRRFVRTGIADSVNEMLEVQNRLFSPRFLAFPVILSVLAWFAECAGLYFTLVGFGCEGAGIGISTFIYSLSTLAGAVSMLPGGLIATEGSMAAMIGEAFGLATAAVALSATIIIRLCTLWFAVLIGLGTAPFLPNKSRMLDRGQLT
ncbi:MAG: flippase-like domain-containing protein, partial [Deltaproteobacteria bacterium]|nr:flippase-like domain-containing protein [Deltaproteobacteria bacterium]